MGGSTLPRAPSLPAPAGLGPPMCIQMNTRRNAAPFCAEPALRLAKGPGYNDPKF